MFSTLMRHHIILLYLFLQYMPTLFKIIIDYRKKKLYFKKLNINLLKHIRDNLPAELPIITTNLGAQQMILHMKYSNFLK